VARKVRFDDEDQYQKGRISLRKAIINYQRDIATKREPGSDDAFRLQQLRTNEILLKKLGFIS